MTIDLPERRTAAHRRPPSFLCVLLLLALTSHAAPGGEYRLAGVVAVGKDFLGFLEVPDGGQVLVRQGSVISGGGRVVALDGERLRIAFPGRTIELVLEGSGAPAIATVKRGAADSGDAGTAREMQVDDQDETIYATLEVDGATVAQALGETSSRGEGRRPDAGTEVARRFATVVDIPGNARVLSVNGTPVTSADAAIKLAEQHLAAGGAVGLKLAATGDGPETRLYLMPANQ